MAKVTASWQCGLCLECHNYEEDAQECCAPRVNEGWSCDACGDFHRTLENASACCGFVCQSCGAWAPDEDAASDCCGVPYIEIPTPFELEAAGQMRLPL